MTETVPPSPVEVIGFAVSHEKAPDIEPLHQEKRNPLLPSISPVMFGPNITGGTVDMLFWDYSGAMSGCFYQKSTKHNHCGDTGSSYFNQLGLDASRSSGLYGDSSTVQPSALRLLPCIKF